MDDPVLSSDPNTPIQTVKPFAPPHTAAMLSCSHSGKKLKIGTLQFLLYTIMLLVVLH
jgi:hypothetical protein